MAVWTVTLFPTTHMIPGSNNKQLLYFINPLGEGTDQYYPPVLANSDGIYFLIWINPPGGLPSDYVPVAKGSTVKLTLQATGTTPFTLPVATPFTSYTLQYNSKSFESLLCPGPTPDLAGCFKINYTAGMAFHFTINVTITPPTTTKDPNPTTTTYIVDPEMYVKPSGG